MAYERRGGAGWTVHPGEILNQEFLVPMHITGYRLAKALDVKPQSINDIVLRKRGISAEMAVRLARFFGTTSEFWMNLQAAYDLSKASIALRRKLHKIKPLRKAA